MRASWLVLALLLCVRLAQADIACDGTDDRLASGVPMTTFLSSSTGTMMVWVKPTGTAGSSGTACGNGDVLLGDDDPAGVDFGYAWITRNSNFAGNDRVCGMNTDSSGPDDVAAPYTVGVWTHLAWVHGGGNLTFYKDGIAQGSVASGTTFWSVPSVSTLSLCNAGPLSSTWAGEGQMASPEMFDVEVPAQEIAAKANARLHRVGSTVRTGAWTLDSCATTGNGHAFYDGSGNGRALTGDDGPDNAGLTCLPNGILTYPWGPD